MIRGIEKDLREQLRNSIEAKVITGNVHIDYRCGDPTCGVTPAMALCAAAVLPAVRSPQITLSIWQVLAVQVLIFMGIKCSQLWQCRRGVS